MKITVEMDLTEFASYQKYLEDEKKAGRKLETFARKITWALALDSKNKEKVVIFNQDDASELLEMAGDILK